MPDFGWETEGEVQTPSSSGSKHEWHPYPIAIGILKSAALDADSWEEIQHIQDAIESIEEAQDS